MRTILSQVFIFQLDLIYMETKRIKRTIILFLLPTADISIIGYCKAASFIECNGSSLNYFLKKKKRKCGVTSGITDRYQKQRNK